MSSDYIRIIPSKDAKITLLSSSVSYEENVLGNKPHETVKCQFRIPSLNVIAGTITSYYVDISRVDAKQENQSLVIDSVLGITSVTVVDRLIELCLMKLTKLEKADFCIETLNGEQNFTISLELVDFEDNYEELFSRHPLSLIEFAAQLKTDGVQLFKEKRITDAFKKFSNACKFLFLIDSKKTENSVLQTKDELLANLYNNLAGCHVSQENWLQVIGLCNFVLQQQQHNVKALFRRGVAFIELQEYEKARQDLNIVMEKEPNNTCVRNKLITLDEKERCLKQKYATAMKKMFS